MFAMEFVVGLLFVFFLLISPILAYRAYVRVRKLEKQSKAAGTENVAARLAALGQKVGELNCRLAETGAAAAAARLPVPAEAAPPTPRDLYCPVYLDTVCHSEERSDEESGAGA